MGAMVLFFEENVRGKDNFRCSLKQMQLCSTNYWRVEQLESAMALHIDTLVDAILSESRL